MGPHRCIFFQMRRKIRKKIQIIASDGLDIVSDGGFGKSILVGLRGLREGEQFWNPTWNKLWLNFRVKKKNREKFRIGGIMRDMIGPAYR